VRAGSSVVGAALIAVLESSADTVAHLLVEESTPPHLECAEIAFT
jgi:hypothetical protein